MADVSASTPKPVFLLTHPRTASNLFVKILKQYPKISSLDYPFLNTYYFGTDSLCLRKSPQMDISRHKWQTSDPRHTYQCALEQLEEVLRQAKSHGKTALVKEHIFTILKPAVINGNIEISRQLPRQPSIKCSLVSSQISTNPTLLPDEFMLSFAPIFLIRHPALVFPSWYRVGRKTMGAEVDDAEFPVDASFRWTRILYEWYENSWSQAILCPSSSQRFRPTIIDADDIMEKNQVLKELCDQLGINFGYLTFQWEPMEATKIAQQDPDAAPFLSTLQQSTSVEMDKHSGNLEIDREVLKWQTEFGAEVAQALLRYVELAMVDYLYLKSRRLSA